MGTPLIYDRQVLLLIWVKLRNNEYFHVMKVNFTE